MRVLINALSARLGGGQTYLVNLLDNLPIDNNLEIFLYAPSSLSINKDKRINLCSTVFPTTNPLLRAMWERMVLPSILKKKILIYYFALVV